MTRGRQLLVVPTGPLANIPLQLLITEKPPGDGAAHGPYGSVPWLVKQNAMTVLPSIATLAALRQNAHRSSAPEPYIAFADPHLLGNLTAATIHIPKPLP